MASATGIPETGRHASETEPLLGRPGDAVQSEDKTIAQNFVIGEHPDLMFPQYLYT
jgi:hypothetical protein